MQLVLYHKSCNDGFCSAWVARKVWKDAVFYPVGYGDPPPDVTGKDVLLLDFSYSRPIIEEMHHKARSFTMLDHHETAKIELQNLDYCIFDMRRSGARLTWDYFNLNRQVPWLVEYTQDCDLWQWRLPHTRQVNSALFSYPMEFYTWDQLDSMISWEDIRSSHCPLVQEGEAIYRYRCQQIKSVLSHANEVILDNHQIMASNTAMEFSDVANDLARNRLFGVAWYQRGDGKYIYSLRSEKSGMDVSKIAKKFGGGGHVHSSGFISNTQVLMTVE